MTAQHGDIKTSISRKQGRDTPLGISVKFCIYSFLTEKGIALFASVVNHDLKVQYPEQYRNLSKMST